MKKQTAHIQNRFLNCLRIAVIPGHHEMQRINSVVNFCKKYAFDNVMLFINAEEFNVGHMTIEEAKPWIEAMKRVKKILREEGITVSLNPWMEMGHLSRGRQLKEGQEFVTMVDYNGTACALSACPMDQNWLEYFLEFYAYIIREVVPEVIWIEDDFRLHNHAPLQYGGCFCEHHMRAFNEELGTNYTREEFTDRLFRKEPDKKVQMAFMEVNRRCMAELAEKIGVMIRNLGLGTKVGLMSSDPAFHAVEYRDWTRIIEGFAQGGPQIDRIHLPLYLEEVSMKYYYQLFNRVAFICRGFIPEGCHVLPELETGAYLPYSKDPEIVRFQLESAIPLEIEGMTYSIFGFEGNGAIEASGYGKEVASIEDYLTAVAESSYSFHSLSGITIPIDEKSAYNRPIKNSFYDMMPNEWYFGSILQGYGISARCSKEKEFNNEVVVLGGGATYNFSDDQLVNLFANNTVILDGETVEHLVERGLGELVGVENYRVYPAEADVHSFEQIEGDDLVCGVPEYRISATKRTGDYIAITYREQPEIKTKVYDFYENEIASGIVISKGHLIVPYRVNGLHSNLLNPMRQQVICNYIDSLKKEFVRADYSSVYAYYSKGEENVLILVNASSHSLPVTRFKMTGQPAKKVYEIERDGIRRQKVFYLDEEGYITLEEPFVSHITKTLVLEI